MAEQEVGRLKVSLSIDSANFEKSISSIDRNLKAMGQEMASARNKGKDWGSSISGLTTKQDTLSRMLSGQETKVSRLRDAYEKSKIETGENSKATENLAIKLNKAVAEYDKTETELKQVTDALKVQQDELKRSLSPWQQLSDKMDTLGSKMKDVGGKMKDVGKNLSLKLTAPLLALGTGAVKAAVDFESGMAGVRKTTDLTDAEFATLTQGIRDMAKEMPAAATEIAGITEQAGQLGIKKEALLSFTRTMADLGVSTNMSSEQASNALARLANITKMNQQDFDKLGSSVVALGNNFATTEGEIVDMALRLAGAGSQIGMSEADILGLSAALSSVGIEAEMGGSAMSRVMVRMQIAATTGLGKVMDLSKKTGMSLRDMQLMAANDGKGFKELAGSLKMTQDEMKSIINAGVDLENFAKVAGMTGEQFKKAFQEDAVGAIASFVEGLGTAEEKGDSAINILEEMGIKEVRLRDSLLRSGGAHKLVADAIELSNKGWTENVALTNEAEQRYATTASKMTVFLNKIKDLGITIGDILIPKVIALMDFIAPLIEKFQGMSTATQNVILVFAGIAAAIGPVLVIVGTLISSIGTIVTAFGTVSAAIAVVTTGVAAATPAVGALAAVFTALTGPVGLIILSIAALTVGTVALVKHLSKDALPAVDRFGDSLEGVSDSTKVALEGFFELSDGVSQSLSQLSLTSSKVTQEMATDMTTKYNEMNKQIVDGLNTRHAQEMDSMKNFFLNSSVLNDEEEAKILEKKQQAHDKEIEREEYNRKRIGEILQQAADDNRALTEREQKVVENINKHAQDQAVKILSESEMEQKIIMERLKETASIASAQQAAEVVKNSAKQRDKSVKEVNAQYDETVASIIRMRDETGDISAEQADKLIAEAKKQRDGSVMYAENMHQDIVSEAKKQAGEHANEVDWETGEILSKWAVFKDKMADTWQRTNEAISKKVSELVTLISTKFTEFHKKIFDKMAETEADIKSRWNVIIEFFKAIDLKQIGKDIILGLINGIGSKFTAVGEAIKGIADNIKDTFTKLFDIHSPSRVMEKLGGHVGQGLKKGIDGTKDDILESMKNIADGIMSMASPRIKSSEKTKVAAMILKGILNRPKHDRRLVFL
ncbi:phage tail tape measure protein [Psychrobacillus glaciei]|uniref:Phage tail tape measure protein n=1 Tax=Psychrobacillus glaciei TaxID=2283160 RepID=A0A5J6SLX3_9BACI|nr:phage tail tape measure protein [Psychrobacillus glaciei]QFF98789.1 phage tail tape measure protein [Psychrobacillus glaciei]